MSAEQGREEASAIRGRREIGGFDAEGLVCLLPMLPLHPGGPDKGEVLNLPGREREKNSRCIRGGGSILDLQC